MLALAFSPFVRADYAWVPSNPNGIWSGSSAALLGVAYSPSLGLYVAVGAQGVIRTSLNAITWSDQPLIMSGSNRVTFSDVIWSPEQSQFVASSYRGSVYTSPDGFTWTERSLGLGTGRVVQGLEWNGSVYVAAFGSLLMSSPDAVDWTSRQETLETIAGVTWNAAAGKFLAASQQTGFLSANGSAWSSGTAIQSTGTSVTSVANNGSTYVAVGAGGLIRTSTDGTTWTTRASGTTGFLVKVLWSASRSQFVVVGEAGIVLTSPNGTTWTRRISGTSNDLNGITWSGSVYVAVGSGGLILTSPDAVAWTKRTPGLDLLLSAGAVGEGHMVAVGSGDSVARSVDARAWSLVNTGFSAYVNAVAWSDTLSRHVAVGAGGAIRTSPDGVTWTNQDSGVKTYLNGVAWVGAQFVAVGEAGVLLTSPDGITWTARTSGTVNWLATVATNGTTLVAVGDAGTIRTSADAGVTWTTRNSGTTAWLSHVLWTGAQFVAVGDLGKILTSPDGVTWTARTSGTTNYFSATAWGASTLVAVGDAGTIRTSADGITWTARTSGTGDFLVGVVWTGAQFLALTDTDVVLTSPNGVTWTAGSLGLTTGGMGCLAWSGSQYIAGGMNGEIVSSTNGTAWTRRAVAVAGALSGVAWGGANYVLVGAGGLVATSPDGFAWTGRVSGITTDLKAVYWNGSQFIAVGAGGKILTSPNGLTWTARTSGTTQDLLAVSGNGALLVATGNAGVIRTSPDGVTWTSRTSGTTNKIQAVAWGASLFVATGDGGTIRTSPDGITWTSRASGLAADIYGIWPSLAALNWNGTQFTTPSLMSADGITWTSADSKLAQATAFLWTGAEMLAITPQTGLGNTAILVNERRNIASLVQSGADVYSSGMWGSLARYDASFGDSTVLSPTSANLHAIAKQGTVLFAVGAAGTVITSTNGSDWTSLTSGTSQDLNALHAGTAQLVAAGAGGVMLTSPDGAVWTARTSGTTQAIHALAHSGSLYVAAGAGGVILTSPDAVSWTARTSGVGTALYAAHWTGAGFVVAGANGVVLTSPDGTSWTARSSGTTAVLYAVASNGSSELVAAGAGGTLLLSTNSGATWTAQSSGTTTTLRAALWTGAAFFVGGDDGCVRSVLLTAPVYSLQPASAVVNLTSTVVLSADSSTLPTPTYQWYKNGVALVNGSGISGATTATLTLTNAKSTTAGNYTVVATNSYGSTTSTAAVITIASAAEAYADVISLEATVIESPAEIRIKTHISGTFDIYRKSPDVIAWGTPVASGVTLASGAIWTDPTPVVGTLYEYRFENKAASAEAGVYPNGYIVSGIAVDRTQPKGRLALVVANDVPTKLPAEYAQYKADLVADGWFVHEIPVPRAPNYDAKPIGAIKTVTLTGGSPGTGYTTGSVSLYKTDFNKYAGGTVTATGGAVSSVNVSAPLLEAAVGTLFKVSTAGASADSGTFAVVEVATLTPESKIATVSVVSGGSGYTDGQAVDLRKLDSVYANAEGSISTSGGAISFLSISDSGTGYPVGTVLDVVQSGGSGSGGKVVVSTVDYSNAALTGVSGGAGGTGYTNGATATFTGATSLATATGTVLASGGVITGYTIGYSAFGFIPGETLTITRSGGGSGATAATASIGNIGPVIRGKIQALYAQYPGELKSVILLGKVPVVRSGLWDPPAPDGHGNRAPYGADAYYAEMDGVWTDTGSNTTYGTSGVTRNVPGDGKFDQGRITYTHLDVNGFVDFKGAAELGFGRIDFACGISAEWEALKNYFGKLHRYKTASPDFLPGRRVADRLSTFNNIRETDLMSCPPIVGMANIEFFTPDDLPSVPAGVDADAAYSAANGPYLFYFKGSNAPQVSEGGRAVFWTGMQSHYGWWYESSLYSSAANSMQKRLAEDSFCLSWTWDIWGVRYLYHRMGMGYDAADMMKVSINNAGTSPDGNYPFKFIPAGFGNGAFEGGLFMNHMGDPALRLFMFAPPTRLSIVKSGANPSLTWTASTEPGLLGYHVYRAATAAGPYTRLTSTPLAGTSFVDSSVSGGAYAYMVRAVRLETTGSGTFFNPSLGVTQTIDLSTTPAAVAVSTSPTLADANWNTAYDLTLTAQGGYPVYTWSLASGTLPAGLTLSADGRLSGTPTGAGQSTFTVRATDALGQSADQVVNLFVQSNASQELLPEATGYTDFSAPAANYGSWDILNVSGQSAYLYETFLRFDLGALDVRNGVPRAKLQVFVTPDTAANAYALVEANLVADAGDGWNESSITYNTRPTALNAAVSAIRATTFPVAGTIMELDVTPFLRETLANDASKKMTIRLSTATQQKIVFASRHSFGTARPRLVIESTDAPAITLTSPTVSPAFIYTGSGLSITATVSPLPARAGALAMSWTKASGPGVVTFGSSSAAATTATFSAAGDYVLRLTASDGVRQSYQDLGVRVMNSSLTGSTDPSLTLRLPLDESSGLTAADASTAANPVALSGSAAVWVPAGGRFGGALTFDGSIDTKTITGCANNGSGKVRVTSPAHGLATGNYVTIAGVTGTSASNINGLRQVTVIDANTYDLTAATYVAGWVVSAATVKHALSYATAPDSVLLDNSQKMTVSLWINPTASDNSTRTILAKYLASGASRAYAVTINNGKVSAQINNATAATGVRMLAAGQWHHVAIVFDGSLTESNLKLYVNGTPETFVQIPDTAVKDADSPLWLGVLNGGDSLGFQGKVDEVRVYRGKALTLTEIADAYQGIPSNLGLKIALASAASGDAGQPFALSASVTDPDGPLPLAFAWTKASGPAGVTFTTPAASSTDATAAAGGVYVIRLSASDGQITTFADALATITASSAYQSWLTANALPSDGTGDGAPTANPSGDGVPNAFKFALGLNVNDPGYAGRMTTEVLDVSGADHLSLTYTRPDPAPAGVVYTVKVSSDLATWSAAQTVEVSNSTAGDLRTITVRDTEALGAVPRRFIRLEISVP